MKAWVLNDVGAIRFGEVPKPQIGETEVLVKVGAAGICGSDIPRIYKDGAHRMPLIIGHEFSGCVMETGSKADESWTGKRVGVYPLIPCHSCIACQKGKHEMCRQYGYLGSRQDGGFAEYVVVPERNLIEIPDNVTYEQAAMLEPMAVAVHAIRRVPVTQDNIAVVCGLGTVGQLLVMFLKERGIKQVLAIGNKDFQKEKFLELGTSEDDFCDARIDDVETWMENRTNGLGVDVFFECVGKNDTVLQAINMTALGGKICLVGNPYLDIKLDQQIYWKILRNQLEIKGTWNSSFFVENKQDSDWRYVLNLLEQGTIKPERLISHRLPLERLEKGLQIMRDKSDEYLKVMIA